MSYRARERRRQQRTAAAAAVKQQRKSRDTGSAERTWWWTLVTTNTSCTRGARTLHTGHVMAYRVTPREALCPTCARADDAISCRESMALRIARRRGDVSTLARIHAALGSQPATDAGPVCAQPYR